MVASESVMALMWNILYTPDNGLFNTLLAAVGLPRQPFLISTTQALPAILAKAIWKDIGFTMLILLAGLQSIPEDFYDAADIDGASAWAKLRHITIPLMRRMILLASFMATIAGSRLFTPIILMTDGGPSDATVNTVFYMYEQAFRFQRMGEASATAVYLIIALVVISLLQSRALRTTHEY
jgi:ABC-type sugar transport system permease subunit